MKRSAGCTSDKINEFGIDQRRSWPVRYSLKPVQPLPYVFHPSRGRKTTRDWARTVNRRLLYMYSSPTLPETVGEISYLVKTIRQRSHSSHRRTYTQGTVWQARGGELWRQRWEWRVMTEDRTPAVIHVSISLLTSYYSHWPDWMTVRLVFRSLLAATRLKLL